MRATLVTLLAVCAMAANAESAKLREPLPIEAAIALRSHISRSIVDLSPDGEWVAHTYIDHESTMPLAMWAYSATGVSFAEGNGRMQACLTNVRTGEVIRLGGRSSSSWAPVWSPDGDSVAFYSDEDSEAGLWIWDNATREAHRFPSVIVRPFIAAESVRWASDSRRLLVKVLPEGMTVLQANALIRANDGELRIPSAGPDDPSVLVLRAGPATAARRAVGQAVATSVPAIVETLEHVRTPDLALLDIETNEIKRIGPRSGAAWWAFSPDERYVAYTQFAGREPDTQQSVADVIVYELATDRRRVLLNSVRVSSGASVSWSPDSQSLAVMSSGQLAAGEVFVVPVDGSAIRNLGDEQIFKSRADRRPLWDARSEHLFLLGGESLWRIEVASGRGVEVARLTGYALRDIVTEAGASTFWSPDSGRSLIVSASRPAESRAGFYQIDLETGASRTVVEETKTYSTAHSIDVDTGRGAFTFVAEDMQHPPDVWLANARTRRARQVTHLNEQIERYNLGRAQLVEWFSAQGENLRGTLLLPAGYQKGQRYPLAVEVYEGRNGAELVNRFAIRGNTATFNYQVLATRGYAVFYPDAPLRLGTPMTDLIDTVMPGVNKLIEMGIADPDRLAVMGQSYGSYCALSLIAQTKRFKAAIITAVTDPNLVSGYLLMGPQGEAAFTGYYEHGQGNMGGTPWEHGDRYLRNSPLFLFDRIETPLLIGHGTKDFLPLRYPDSVFVGLRRLGKEVEYRIYEGEEHVITRKPNVIDFWNRRLQFLDEHLGNARDATSAKIASAAR